jgi:hypothetical protein
LADRLIIQIDCEKLGQILAMPGKTKEEGLRKKDIYSVEESNLA